MDTGSNYSLYSVYLIVPGIKKLRRKTNNPPDLPFLVLVLGETPQQILLLTDR